MTQHVSQDVKV